MTAIGFAGGGSPLTAAGGCGLLLRGLFFDWSIVVDDVRMIVCSEFVSCVDFVISTPVILNGGNFYTIRDTYT